MTYAAAALLGVMTWTLLEYALHRFFGHDKRTMPNPFGTEHTQHHSQGNYFAPSWKKAPLALLAFGFAYAAVAPLCGTPLALTYAASLITMYVAYEVVHRRAHTHEGIGAYGRYLRRHHFHHHFANPRANHGVTSPLWDYVFRTHEVPSRIRVPEKLRMQWLIDDDGCVREKFRDNYELARRTTLSAARDQPA